MAKRNLGIGTLLIAVYGIFALSSTARAGYQLITKFSDAPLAYSLSAISALVYILATVALAKEGPAWLRIAKATVWFELLGVVFVGFLSVLIPQWFAHPSVWSSFGSGYVYIPLVLPVLGLIWLRKQSAKS